VKARTAKGPSSQCVGSKETLAAFGHHERWGLFGSQVLAKHPPRLLRGMRGILPISYTLSSDVLNVGSDPFASGGYDDVYEGSLDGSERSRVASNVCGCIRVTDAIAFPVCHH